MMCLFLSLPQRICHTVHVTSLPSSPAPLVIASFFLRSVNPFSNPCSSIKPASVLGKDYSRTITPKREPAIRFAGSCSAASNSVTHSLR
ncbi:hypothetical protein BDV98DRAFT_263135 [Pterulicium gracile]|uniref:Uncharacterized protein n=1 Tax=Pterulicium gracile TaxID=1884261 RepID=A0A5C3QGM2_9AGAR|nr:hypothetical protein BDV98DRAFT_263135 [Pterula gracilis]